MNRCAVLDKLNAALFFATVLLLPFQHYPHGVFSRLSLYPLMCLGALNLPRLIGFVKGGGFLRLMAVLFALCLGCQMLMMMAASGFAAAAIKSNFKAMFPDVCTWGSFFVLIASFRLFPAGRAQRIFHRAFSTTFLMCASYSVIEILHFCGVKSATRFLSGAIRFFSDVCLDGGWWPPVLWDGVRLRSFFAEPSGYAILSVFAVWYFGICACTALRRADLLKNLALSLLALLMVCGTRSCSASITMMFFTAFFAAVWFCLRTKLQIPWRKRWIPYLAGFVAASILIAGSQRGGFCDFEKLVSAFSADCQPDEQGGSSSKTRMLHLQAQLRLIKARPVSGYGAQNYAPVMRRELAAGRVRTSEIDMWIRSGNIPPLNFFGYTAVKYGVPCMLMLMAAIFLPAFAEVKSRWRRGMGAFDFGVCAAALPLLAILVFMNGSSLAFVFGVLLSVPLTAVANNEMIGDFATEHS